jgi:hypothetical protein
LSELFLDKCKDLAKEVTQIWVSCFLTSEITLQKRSLKFEWAVFWQVKRPRKRDHSNLSELFFDKCKDLAKEVTQIWVSCFLTSEITLQKRSLKFEWAVFWQVKRPCKRGHSNLSELFFDKWKDLAKEVTQIWVSCFWTSVKTLQKRSLKFEWAVFWQVKLLCKRGHSNLSELFFYNWKDLAKEITQIWVICFWTRRKSLQKRSLKFEWAVFWQVKRPCKRGHSNLSELFFDKWKDLAKEVTQIWVSCFLTSEKTSQKRSLKFEWAIFWQVKLPCKRGHLNLSKLFMDKRNKLAKEVTQSWMSCLWTSEKSLQKRLPKFEWAVFGKEKRLAKELTQIWVSCFLTSEKTLQKRSLKFEWAVFWQVKRPCKRGHSNLSELFFDKWNYFAKEVTQIWVSCFLTSEKTLQKRSLKFEWAVFWQVKRPCKRGHSNLSELFLDKWKDLTKEVTQIWVSCFWTSEKTLQKRSLKFEWAVFEQVKRPCKRGHSNLSELFFDKWKDLAKEVTQIWVSCFLTS